MINIDNVYKYCAEDIALIENYEKAIYDTKNIWVCHHRLEIQGDKIYSPEELKEMNLYYHRPACELLLLTHREHIILHNKNRKEETFKKISEKMKGNKNCVGRKLSESTKKILSEQKKGKMSGKKNPMYGKHHTSETKKKMSESLKGCVPWSKGKKYSEESRQKMRDAWVKRKQKLEVKYTKNA